MAKLEKKIAGSRNNNATLQRMEKKTFVFLNYVF